MALAAPLWVKRLACHAPRGTGVSPVWSSRPLDSRDGCPTPDGCIMACMNATPLLSQILRALHEHRLEAVLIGNAAAAVHGAPVTTLDFDFMFRDTPTNMRKLKGIATDLRATILRPFYPVSKLYRVVNEDSGLQADFMPVIHGVRSFEGLRSRADARDIDGLRLLVASLDDIIASKKAAGRDRDKAVLSILEQTRRSVRKRGAHGS